MCAGGDRRHLIFTRAAIYSLLVWNVRVITITVDKKESATLLPLILLSHFLTFPDMVIMCIFRGEDSSWQFASKSLKKCPGLYSFGQGLEDTQCRDNDSKWGSIYWKGEAECVSQETVNLSRQKRLPRICRCLKYLHKVCVDIQSLFAACFLSFLRCEIVYILPLRWNTGETL